MKTKREAESIGREHCPPGWTWTVWYNLSWHVLWQRGPVSVYKYEEGFLAMIASKHAECGHGGPWTNERPYSNSVLKAAKIAVEQFRQYVREHTKTWADTDAAVSRDVV